MLHDDQRTAHDSVNEILRAARVRHDRMRAEFKAEVRRGLLIGGAFVLGMLAGVSFCTTWL